MTEEFRYQTEGEAAIAFDYEVETQEGLARRAKVRVPAEPIETKIKEQAQIYSKQVNLPGFRKGKVPLNVIMQRFGDSIKAEALEQALKEIYPSVLDKEDDVAGVLGIDLDGGIEVRDGAYHFLVDFEVNPSVDFKLPKKIAFKAPIAEIDDAEVDTAIEGLRGERAEFADKDGAADTDDYVTVKYKLTEGNEELGDERTARICIGKDQLAPTVDDALKGESAGAEKTVEVAYDSDAPSGFAGRTIVYALQVEKVEARALPEVNDDFAKSFEGVEDLEDMKSKIRSSLSAERVQAERQVVHKEILTALRDANPMDLPESFVAQVQSRKADELLGQFQQQGMMQGKVDDQTKAFAFQAVRGAAELAAHDSYMVRELVKELKIEVDETTIGARLEELGLQYGMDVEQVRNELGEQGIESVADELRNQKALEAVEEKAKIERLSWEDWQKLQAEMQAEAAAKQAAAQAEAAAADDSVENDKEGE